MGVRRPVAQRARRRLDVGRVPLVSGEARLRGGWPVTGPRGCVFRWRERRRSTRRQAFTCGAGRDPQAAPLSYRASGHCRAPAGRATFGAGSFTASCRPQLVCARGSVTSLPFYRSRLFGSCMGSPSGMARRVHLTLPERFPESATLGPSRWRWPNGREARRPPDVRLMEESSAAECSATAAFQALLFIISC